MVAYVRVRRSVVLMVLLGALGLALAWRVGPVRAEESGYGPYAPSKPPSRPVRVGYLEGGPYVDYPRYFRATIDGLEELGWINKVELPAPAQGEESWPTWQVLARQASGPYMRFVEDAFYSANWDEEERTRVRERLLDRLSNKRDLDMMVALGTWAGQDLATDRNTVNTIVISTSDPLRAGIVKSADYSGRPNLNAHYDPDRYTNQLRLFHDMVGFSRLGVCYEDTVAGRSYAALEDIYALARERGFAVVECKARLDVPSPEESFENLLACHEQLAPKVDAMYLTANNGMQLEHMAELLAPFFRYRVPTFSQNSIEEVRTGALMTTELFDARGTGRHVAKVMGMIINGEKPGNIPLAYEERVTLAINLEAARRIGFDIPLKYMAGAPKIFHSIEPAFMP